MEWYLLALFVAVMLFFYLAVVVLYKPLRLLLNLAVSLVTGLVLLFLLNLLLGCFGMHVAVNPFTVLVAGLLQLPGVLLLLILAVWLV